jgi:hypothetical protein
MPPCVVSQQPDDRTAGSSRMPTLGLSPTPSPAWRRARSGTGWGCPRTSRWLYGAATSPVGRADELRRSVPRRPWRTMHWRQGPKGWLRQKFVDVRWWRVASAGHRHVGRLLGQRATRRAARGAAVLLG